MVDAAADRTRAAAEAAAEHDRVPDRAADELRETATFLRQLKPSLIAARLRGDAPTDQEPGSGTPAAPSSPQLGERSNGGGDGGPNPLVLVGAALLVGVLLARIIDWRGHAHPRA